MPARRCLSAVLGEGRLFSTNCTVESADSGGISQHEQDWDDGDVSGVGEGGGRGDVKFA